MSIHYDRRNKRYRFTFNRVIQGHHHRHSRLLPKGWSQAEADAYDGQETARLYALATGVRKLDPLIVDAVKHYLTDKSHLKSIKTAREHLAATVWAYDGKPMSKLSEVAEAIKADSADLAPATVKQRLALLKAACRWGWRVHKMTENDPTTGMRLPSVRNERHVYMERADMLKACRACRNWDAQIAMRVAFYTGMRLGEVVRAIPDGDSLVLADTKNGERRVVPVHPKIRHLLKRFPLSTPQTYRTVRTRVQSAALAALREIGATFHDLRHSAASEMVNAGVPLFVVGQVLGHVDQRSTKRYAHLKQDTMAAAVGTIGKRRS